MADRSNPVSSALFDLRLGFRFSVFRCRFSVHHRDAKKLGPGHQLSIAVNDAYLKN
jgi:hypothetical protein